MPLPSGGNFNGIQWGVDDGTWAQTGAEGMLEYNSACQWLRAWRDGRDADLALKVLSTAAGWPALRGTDSGELLTRVAAEASAGGGRTTTADAGRLRPVPRPGGGDREPPGAHAEQLKTHIASHARHVRLIVHASRRAWSNGSGQVE